MHRIVMDAAERLRRKNQFDAGLVMGVAAFHKATGRERHLAENLQALVDPATGLVRAELSRPRPCPICGGIFDQPIFIKNGFPHGRCPGCGLIYVSPVLTDEAAEAHYREERSWVQVLTSQPQQNFDRLKYAYGLDVAAEHFAARNVLDVGAGQGLFVRTARDRGLEAAALELHRENADQLNREGFEVYNRPLAEAGIADDRFGLVTLWEVLEHIADPRSLLAEISRVLSPGGGLLILVPNADALATRILHRECGTFGGHSHVNFFNHSTLTRLLTEEGYRVLEAETLISELGVINNHLNFEAPYSGRTENWMDFLTPELVHRELMGGKLLVLAENGKEEAVS